jgi:hypothetical protein
MACPGDIVIAPPGVPHCSPTTVRLLDAGVHSRESDDVTEWLEMSPAAPSSKDPTSASAGPAQTPPRTRASIRAQVHLSLAGNA